MPKVKISEYSATANSNTDVASINIDEGCAPSGINNAIRAVMGHLKDFQSGTSNDPFTIGSSGSLTLSYGTANGVAYLNGSKVLTTGSALVFDGTNLGVGGTPSYRLDVSKATAGDVARFTNGGASNKSLFVYTDATYAAIATGVGASGNGIALDAVTNKMLFTTASTNQMALDASGNLGIGTTSPSDTIGYGRALDIQSTTGAAIYLRDSDNPTTQYAAIAFDGNASVNNLNIINSSSTGPIRLFTNGAERARIDSSGNLLVGKTSLSTTTVGVELRPGGRVVSTLASSTSGDSTYEVYSTGAGAYRFYVDMSGTIRATSITITAISDERLKENVRDIDTGLNSIMALKPRRFDWKEGKGQDKKNVAGFIAQEFETVFPECVSTSRAGADGIEYKNINHETLIPTLVKSIQEQQALITQLTARITALESA